MCVLSLSGGGKDYYYTSSDSIERGGGRAAHRDAELPKKDHGKARPQRPHPQCTAHAQRARGRASGAIQVLVATEPVDEPVAQDYSQLSSTHASQSLKHCF